MAKKPLDLAKRPFYHWSQRTSATNSLKGGKVTNSGEHAWFRTGHWAALAKRTQNSDVLRESETDHNRGQVIDMRVEEDASVACESLSFIRESYSF